MLSGASGYIGSLVMEQLLRTTDVGKVLTSRGSDKPVQPLQQLSALLLGLD
jgi:short subunit dehydrogenase-like uncharacterized protein